MGCCLKLLGLSALVLALGVGYVWHKLQEVEDPPKAVDRYWGKGESRPDDPAIKPFKIQFTDTLVKDLLDRLAKTRELTPPLEGAGFTYGMNTDYLKGILKFWRTEYNFKERQDFLNQYPHYKTQISGLDIHYMHVKPDPSKTKNVEVVPLLLLHGWPGSVREFYDMIPMLTTPRSEEKFVFEVIAPSLPGYAFSEGAAKPGMGAGQIAIVMKKLMNRLGYDKFYIQGGDWGSAIGQALSVFYPETVLAYHSNMCAALSTRAEQFKFFIAHMMPWLFAEEGYEGRLSEQPSFILEETGYLHIQSTKPDTVGVGLSDSPAGLAAYILEKFSTLSDPAWRTRTDGGLDNWNKVHLLDNIMIYWATSSMTTAMRLYAETFNSAYMFMNKYPVRVPTGCARFPHEGLYVPRSILQTSYPNLIRLTDMPKGGHFAAFEVPQLLSEDIWQFVGTVRKLKTAN